MALQILIIILIIFISDAIYFMAHVTLCAYSDTYVTKLLKNIFCKSARKVAIMTAKVLR